MKTQQSVQTRREFMSDVGRGMVTAAVGYGMACELGLASALADEPAARLDFGELEPLVRMMQETPVEKLLPALVAKLRVGTELKQLVAAGALANARTFGGDAGGFVTSTWNGRLVSAPDGTMISSLSLIRFSTSPKIPL